jgi:DNA modification methylase
VNTVSPDSKNQNNNQITLLQGDALEMLRTLPDQCINAGITSPPYFRLRNYGIEGQLGLEKTVEDYIANLVRVFDEFRRVLRDDGTLWVVIGDS